MTGKRSMPHRAPLALCLLLCFMIALSPTAAQNSEYSQPSFDSEHGQDSFMPVETVDLLSGALTLVYADVHLPGPNGLDLDVMRWYSSKINRWDENCLNPQFEETPVGIGWKLHMGRLWDNPISFPTSGPQWRLELPGGHEEEFFEDDVLLHPTATHVSKGGWILFTESVGGATVQAAVSPHGIK